MNASKTKLKNDQKGLVAIVVTLLIVLLISLISLGFARLVRREQRQSLDRQLSSQAFYAAESGVNDAVEALKSGAQTGAKTTCDPAPWEDQTLDANGQVSYTCVLVNPTPTELKFDSVDANSTVFPIRPADGSAVGSVNVEWQDANNGTNFACPASGQFPSTWPCDTGVLRIDLVPFGTTKLRSQLIDQTFSAVFYPQTGGGSVSYASGSGLAAAGPIINGNCSSGVCRVTVSGLTENNYYARIRSIYKSSKVTVSVGAGNVALSGAQAIVDSTGKVSDVLRRIQVSVSLTSGASVPDFALQLADGFCKRFSIAPGLVSSDPVSPSCDPTIPGF